MAELLCLDFQLESEVYFNIEKPGRSLIPFIYMHAFPKLKTA